MKITGIQTYSPQYSKYCRNNVSKKNNKPYQDIQTINRNVPNIAFKAVDTKLLNPEPFYDRIVPKGTDLGKFLEEVFGKIYKKDPVANIATYNNVLGHLFDCTDSSNFVVLSDVNNTNVPFADSSEYVESLINKGTNYHKQAIDGLNKIRRKIHDILKQYGFDSDYEFNSFYDEDYYNNTKELLYKLTFDPAIKKEFILGNSNKDGVVLVLPDKNDKDTVIKYAIERYDANDPNCFVYNRDKIVNLHLSQYKDSKNCYNIADGDVELTTDDGTLLSFLYFMPTHISKYGQFHLQRLNLNDEIHTLQPEDPMDLLGSFLINNIYKEITSKQCNKFGKYAKGPIMYIHDCENGIIYNYKFNKGIEEIAGASDLKKGIMLIMNDAKKLVEDRKIAIGTSLYTNLFQEGKPMGACVVLPYDIRKSMDAIKQEIEPHILNGVGTGFNLSNTEEPVKVLKSLNEFLKEYDHKTQRPPAGIAILDVTHKDILSFINAKRNADFNNWRFNISVSVPNDFMEKVANDKTIQLTDGKEVKAKSIYNAIIDSMHYCGEPGIVFKDQVEAANPLPNHMYKGMASCAEIGLENGEMCLFSHLNLSKVVTGIYSIDKEELIEPTEVLARLLDNVIDINLAEKVGKDNIASQKRRFGIGVCGFADLLAELGIPYGSKRSKEILAQCLEVINYSSKKASMELAKERGAFPLFKESRYNEKDFLIKHLDEGSLIKMEEWDKLYKDIQKYGLRNATTTSLPPTGSSSRIVGASFSIEPYFTLKGNKIFLEKLDELGLSQEQKQRVIDKVNETGSCQDIEFLPKEFREIFRLGNEISYEEHINMVATAQKFVDDGISKTVNFDNSATIDDIDNAVRLAYELGLKGISVFRDGCLPERILKQM